MTLSDLLFRCAASARGLAGLAGVTALLICPAARTWAQVLPRPLQVTGKQVSERGEQTTQLRVRLFVDSTSSMKGFVSPGADASFVRFIQRFEQAFSFAWPGVEVRCFQFGLKVTEAGLGRCYTRVNTPQSFNIPRRQDFTHLEAVLSIPRTPVDLDVIVTDLFQNDGDLATLFRLLRSQVFEKELSLGVVGMRGGFKGTVYDIGLTRGACEHTGLRPVYALVVGQAGNVGRYFREISGGPGAVDPRTLLILSPYLLEKRLSWKDTPRTQPSMAAEDPGLVRIQPGGAGESYGVVKVQTSSGMGSVKLTLPLGAARFHPAIPWRQAGAVRWNAKVFLFNPKGTAAQEMAAQKVVFPEVGVGEGGEEATVQLRWRADQMLKGRDYLLDLTPEVERDAISLPAFVREWNQAMVVGEPCKNFDRSKTQNLEEFLVGAWRTLYDVRPPQLGSIWIYFGKS